MRIIWAVAAALIVGTTVNAEEEVPPPLWAGEIGVSYVANSGNTNNSTLGASGQLIWQPGKYKLTGSGGFIRTVTDDEVGSKRLGAGLRAEHTLPLRLSAYTEASYYEDPPAGTRNQYAANIGGLGHILKGETRSVDVSLSLTRTFEQRIVAPDRNFLGGQVGIEFQVQLNEVLVVEHASSYVRDFSDVTNWRLKSSTAIGAALNHHLAVKFSHLLYRNKPDPGKHSTDTTIVASLVAAWPAPKK